jgi:hypothetical protein
MINESIQDANGTMINASELVQDPGESNLGPLSNSVNDLHLSALNLNQSGTIVQPAVNNSSLHHTLENNTEVIHSARQSNKPDFSTIDLQSTSKTIIADGLMPRSKKDSQPNISNNIIRFNTNFVSTNNKFRFGSVKHGATG